MTLKTAPSLLMVEASITSPACSLRSAFRTTGLLSLSEKGKIANEAMTTFKVIFSKKPFLFKWKAKCQR